MTYLASLTILVRCNHVLNLLVVSGCHDFNKDFLVGSSSLKKEHDIKYEVASSLLVVPEVS